MKVILCYIRKGVIKIYYGNLLNRSQGEKSSGSITLEAAILLPSLFIFFLINALCLYAGHCAFYWHSALNKTSQEQRLTLILANNVANFSRLNEEGQKILQELPDGWRNTAMSLGATALTSNYLGKEVEKWYSDVTDNSQLFKKLPSDKKFFLDFDVVNNVIWLGSKFSINLGVGKIKIRDKVPIPLWIGVSNGEAGNDSEESANDEDENFWQWHNFKRGNYLREELGGNLPKNYPVIAGFEHGTITMIKSIDLTAPTWHNQEKLQMQIDSFINKLRHFNGTSKPWGKDKIDINVNNIMARKLIIVIPTNSNPEIEQFLVGVLESARAEGIEYEIIRREDSHRFDKDDKDHKIDEIVGKDKN